MVHAPFPPPNANSSRVLASPRVLSARRSVVQLRTTYLDERVRLGKGSRGSLFVFTRGGAADRAGEHALSCAQAGVEGKRCSPQICSVSQTTALRTQCPLFTALSVTPALVHSARAPLSVVSVPPTTVDERLFCPESYDRGCCSRARKLTQAWTRWACSARTRRWP